MQQPEETDFVALLRCLICQKPFEYVRPDAPQPYGGLTFRAYGNYGSRVFDPFDSRKCILALVCDDCVTERIDCVVLEEVDRRVRTVGYTSLTHVSELPE